MCGIAGFVDRSRLAADTGIVLARMTFQLAHRGPDDADHHVGLHSALGHRRLSIVDLSGGRQPLTNENGSLHLVLNGEIYNHDELRPGLLSLGHKFRTASDAECVLHLYEENGDSCLDKIGGMFAFALWDESRRRLFAARDRMGVKPFYYAHIGDRLIFASEIKAILVHPGVQRELDLTALADYLTYGFIPAPKTIFRSVQKLPAGHSLVFQDGRLTIQRYWDLQFRDHIDPSRHDPAQHIWSQLVRAAKLRMPAEVSVGAFLSGGVDSTAVVAAMQAEAANPITTITCGFDDAGFDETQAAAETAELIGTAHHELRAQCDQDAIVDALAWHFDEPFADASAIPCYYLAKVARGHVKVALSGDGGDEILAGYRRYRFDVREQMVRDLVPNGIRQGVMGSLARAYPRYRWMPRVLRAGATLRNLSVDGATAHAMSISTLGPERVGVLINESVAATFREYDPLDHAREIYAKCDAPDHLSKCQYVDLRLGLADGILTKVDRTSMAHGLEVRSPMLDYRFVEEAWRIPPDMRMNLRAGKIPLRQTVAKRVGRRIAWRRKRGFEVPLDDWCRGPLAERLHNCVKRGPLTQWLNMPTMKAILSRHLAKQEDNGPTLWKLLMLDAWARRFLAADEPSSLSRERLAVEPLNAAVKSHNDKRALCTP